MRGQCDACLACACAWACEIANKAVVPQPPQTVFGDVSRGCVGSAGGVVGAGADSEGVGRPPQRRPQRNAVMHVLPGSRPSGGLARGLDWGGVPQSLRGEGARRVVCVG